MPETLLRTKLFVPALRPNLVQRPQLIERLNQGLQLGQKLTLISAPAGFGKTTLACEWVTGNTRPAAWLSLDDEDSDTTRFLAYLVAVIQTIAPNIGDGVLAMLHSPQPPPAESILKDLINEITTIPDDFMLILDDYHVIDANTADPEASVDDVLTFLLEHLPPQMHLIITTREDPHLPLARLRGRGQLNELRVTDLRFTNSEATVFLNQVMSLNLSDSEVASLEVRTEGWIVGLQMAALSMQGRTDISSFIQAFAGSHHFVLDYLVEEVLRRQPEHVRSFLLQTSMLDRLYAPLCDAVTGQEDGKRMLENLERGDLFVVPLDDERQWFRYHHLFADVLQALLMEEHPNQIPTLNRRASEWYEHNGLPAFAISHALAAEDFERVAGLVELAWPAMDWSFQSTTWLGWVKSLPDDLVRARPVLSASYAWALLNDGELEASEARLQDAERWIDNSADMGERRDAPSDEMTVVDMEQFRSLPVTIASARAFLAQALGDIHGGVKYGRLALNLLPEGDHQGRGRAAVLLGLAYWAGGDLEAAHRSFADAMDSFQMAGNILFAVSFTFILADIRTAQGRLREALGTYARSLQLAAEQGEPALQGTANLYLGLSELHYEQDNLEACKQYLLKSDEIGDRTEVYRYRWCRFQARIKEARGDHHGALDLLDEAERWLFYRTPIPDVRPISALKTRVWVAQSRLDEALEWTRERELSVDDDLSYLREFEHFTLARVLIAQYKSNRLDGSIHEAVELIERLLIAAEEGGRTGSVIGILVLQALAHHAQGDISRALNSLERALALAEPEGYVRIFVNEGPPMAALLREAARHGITQNYVSQLRAAFGKIEGRSPVTQPLTEPLSERELEVLRLLGTELNGPEIARELMVSPNTMRTHTKNIYKKLGVHSRREAVRLAEELDLL